MFIILSLSFVIKRKRNLYSTSRDRRGDSLATGHQRWIGGWENLAHAGARGNLLHLVSEQSRLSAQWRGAQRRALPHCHKLIIATIEIEGTWMGLPQGQGVNTRNIPCGTLVAKDTPMIVWEMRIRELEEAEQG